MPQRPKRSCIIETTPCSCNRYNCLELCPNWCCFGFHNKKVERHVTKNFLTNINFTNIFCTFEPGSAFEFLYSHCTRIFLCSSSTKIQNPKISSNKFSIYRVSPVFLNQLGPRFHSWFKFVTHLKKPVEGGWKFGENLCLGFLWRKAGRESRYLFIYTSRHFIYIPMFISV